jgi:hypothetical protein
MPDEADRFRRLVVLDGNAPWVRSLVLAMPPEIDIRFLRVGKLAFMRSATRKPWRELRKWHSTGSRGVERWVIIPGWRTSPRISTWLVKRAVLSAVDTHLSGQSKANRSSTAVIFTLPQYAGVAEGITDVVRAYDAHDAFEFYAWEKKLTQHLQTRLLQACDVTFGVANALCDDLRARTLRPVRYSPMAVSSHFITALADPNLQCPVELAALPRPIIGCTGFINETYDWEMLSQLTTLLSDASFVFIGPVSEENGELRARIDRVLNGRPNVYWLGAKDHGDLPSYLHGFDICLNPLTPSAHSNRRSPLRLFDFLATSVPVVSTAIAEAAAHEGHVWVGANAEEIAIIIRQALSGERKVDLPARRQYLQRNTWEARARTFLQQLGSIPCA